MPLAQILRLNALLLPRPEVLPSLKLTAPKGRMCKQIRQLITGTLILSSQNLIQQTFHCTLASNETTEVKGLPNKMHQKVLIQAPGYPCAQSTEQGRHAV